MTEDDAKDSRVVYLPDTNVLIGFSLWIPISLNELFWRKFEESLVKGEWILLDAVVKEITFNGDLKKWCKEQDKKGLVRAVTDDDRNRGIEINNTYKMIDDVTLKSTVDTYLIAHAEANNLVVFSRESPRKPGTALYKIPDVCHELKVRSISKPEVFLKAIGYKN